MGRAGTYIKQPTGYRAFIPNPLPPDPPIVMSSRLQQLLSDADQALGRLDGSIETLPHAEVLVRMYVRKEAVLSSQIEGTQSTLSDLLAAEADVLDPDRPRDTKEVMNYVAAMNHGLARLDELPISGRLIRDIHAVLMEGVRGGDKQPGQFRTSQNWIGAPGSTISTADFIPPPPNEVLPAISDLEHFLHEDTTLPHLVKVGLAHVQFETIHPFLDGNGRVGRLLITFLLRENRTLKKPTLYISHYFRRNQSAYYRALQAVHEMGDWEGWLAFFLEGVRIVAEEARDTAAKILQMREEHRTRIQSTFGRTAANGLEVLETLYRKPFIDVNEIAALTGTRYRAANDLTERFVEAGILREVTGNRRNRRFAYEPYIGLFG